MLSNPFFADTVSDLPAPSFGKVSNKQPFQAGDRAQKPKPFIKPPSARSGWCIAVCIGIKATSFNGSSGLTREWTFVACEEGEVVTVPGDSGSSLLDRSANVAAMAWGSLSREKNVVPPLPDLTYATPFHLVLEGIEDTMGWERGSVAWCD